MSKSMFDLQDDFDSIFFKMDEYEQSGEKMPEDVQLELDAFYANLVLTFESKVDNYCYVIADAKGKEATIKAEEKRLMALRKMQERKSKKLRSVILQTMQQIGMTKLDTGLHKLSVGKAGGKRKLEITCDVESLPEMYRTSRLALVIEPDKECILDAMGDDTTIPDLRGVTLHPHATIVRIK
jgi:hypothetical protein